MGNAAPFYIIIYLCYGDEFMQYYSLLSGKLISNPPPRMNSRSKLSTLTWTLGGIIFVPSIFSKYSFAFVLSTVFFSAYHIVRTLIDIGRVQLQTHNIFLQLCFINAQSNCYFMNLIILRF